MTNLDPDPDPSRRDFLFAVMSLDLTRGLLAPMGLVLQPAGEEALRELLRAVRSQPLREGEAPAEVLARRLARTVAAVEEANGRPFADYLLAWSRDVLRHPAGDPQAFLWGRLVERDRTARTPPSLVARARAELSRNERPVVPEVPRTSWDIELVAALGYPVRPEADGKMAASPMSLVHNRIAHVTFVRAWDKALSRAADPADETDAAFQWGQAEAPALGVARDLVLRPGNWPALPQPAATSAVVLS